MDRRGEINIYEDQWRGGAERPHARSARIGRDVGPQPPRLPGTIRCPRTEASMEHLIFAPGMAMLLALYRYPG